mmetsp:Transcript_3554/g.7780  ORF Transcript_3554/g.7780 Transcript_3554/m.7780 type:complete len:121 (-) Transcript_3554:58-420(-)
MRHHTIRIACCTILRLSLHRTTNVPTTTQPARYERSRHGTTPTPPTRDTAARTGDAGTNQTNDETRPKPKPTYIATTTNTNNPGVWIGVVPAESRSTPKQTNEKARTNQYEPQIPRCDNR